MTITEDYLKQNFDDYVTESKDYIYKEDIMKKFWCTRTYMKEDPMSKYKNNQIKTAVIKLMKDDTLTSKELVSQGIHVLCQYLINLVRQPLKFEDMNIKTYSAVWHHYLKPIEAFANKILNLSNYSYKKQTHEWALDRSLSRSELLSLSLELHKAAVHVKYCWNSSSSASTSKNEVLSEAVDTDSLNLYDPPSLKPSFVSSSELGSYMTSDNYLHSFDQRHPESSGHSSLNPTSQY